MRSFSRRQWMIAAGAGLAAASTPIASGQSKDASADEMILVPAGPFLMGTTEAQARDLAKQYGHHVSWLSGEVPQHTRKLPAFLIDKYPVTNRQFSAFCKATGFPPRRHWGGPEPLDAIAEHPVVMVDKAAAEAYAKWAGKRLPIEAEWEKAARGADGRLYPWGNEFDPAACQWDPGGDPNTLGTAPVNAHPKGASPYDVMDMVGNAAEWCADSPGPGASFIKGGCWLTASPLNLRAAARNMSGFANNSSMFYGFRCAKEAA